MMASHPLLARRSRSKGEVKERALLALSFSMENNSSQPEE
jgi:hypothetical protein